MSTSDATSEGARAFAAAVVAHRAGRLADALQEYRRVLTLIPNHADALHMLGALAGQQGDFVEAETQLRAALRMQDAAPIHNNLGLALEKQGKRADAEASYRRAIQLAPGYADAYEKLGNLIRAPGRLAESAAAFRSAWRLNPGNASVLGKLYFIQRALCAWDELSTMEAAIVDLMRRSAHRGLGPFEALTASTLGPADHRAIAAAFAEFMFGPALQVPPVHRNQPGERARLRIGYLSADFHEHATVRLMGGVLENHDPQKFSVNLYSYGPETRDAASQRVQRASALFRDLRGFSDEDAARQIAADRIDVLIDLKGYTENMRLGIVAFRPAPVVVSWLGWPGTVGHQRLADYIIGDPTVTPPDVAADYSEALAIMPHCYQSNDRSRTVGPRPTRTEAGLPEEGFVFCSFNQMWKIGPETFSVWCRLLDAVPGSVLWLLDTRDNAGANLRQEAQRRGVDPGRVIFAPTLPYSGHLGRLQLADLVLDVFPYGSHTTASDALWCGVPVVTKIGEIFASRVSASLLNAAGLPELVTTSDNDYFTLALRLAMQPGEIGCLRDRIVATRMSVPLFDTVRFTRDLERLYDEIWKQAMRGKREPITLEPRAGR